jgi:murein DD-endopeptidase MepM/ murein hydrolase activator NlpD
VLGQSLRGRSETDLIAVRTHPSPSLPPSLLVHRPQHLGSNDPQQRLGRVTFGASGGTLGLMTPLALGAVTAALALLVTPFAGSGAQSPAPMGSSATIRAASGADWPVAPTRVITPFDDPLPYAAGHRGVDLAAAPGQTVNAALPGRVSVAGYVAGRPLVVIEHQNDVRTTYLPVLPSVSVGDLVKAGEPIGSVDSSRSSASAEHCMGSPCLHWGARRGAIYIDPQSLLRSGARLTGPIVLLPEP